MAARFRIADCDLLFSFWSGLALRDKRNAHHLLDLIVFASVWVDTLRRRVLNVDRCQRCNL